MSTINGVPLLAYLNSMEEIQDSKQLQIRSISHVYNCNIWKDE